MAGGTVLILIAFLGVGICLRRRYWWNLMKPRVEKIVLSCVGCLHLKKQVVRPPLYLGWKSIYLRCQRQHCRKSAWVDSSYFWILMRNHAILVGVAFLDFEWCACNSSIKPVSKDSIPSEHHFWPEELHLCAEGAACASCRTLVDSELTGASLPHAWCGQLAAAGAKLLIVAMRTSAVTMGLGAEREPESGFAWIATMIFLRSIRSKNHCKVFKRTAHPSIGDFQRFWAEGRSYLKSTADCSDFVDMFQLWRSTARSLLWERSSQSPARNGWAPQDGTWTNLEPT